MGIIDTIRQSTCQYSPNMFISNPSLNMMTDERFKGASIVGSGAQNQRSRCHANSILALIRFFGGKLGSVPRGWLPGWCRVQWTSNKRILLLWPLIVIMVVETLYTNMYGNYLFDETSWVDCGKLYFASHFHFITFKAVVNHWGVAEATVFRRQWRRDVTFD